MTNNADEDVNLRFQLILLISGPIDKPLVSANIHTVSPRVYDRIYFAHYVNHKCIYDESYLSVHHRDPQE